MSHITRNPDICGGEPIIRGMRITVRDVIEYLELYGEPEQVLEALPDLTRDDIEAAVDYYRNHREEIERYRREEEESELEGPNDES